MKKYIVLFFFLSACAKSGDTIAIATSEVTVTEQTSCTVTQLPDGAVINCPDGTSAVVDNVKHNKRCKRKHK